MGHVLWLRASLFTAGAVGAALLAQVLGPLVPRSLVDFVGEKPAEELLKVMASSMLAVATFSLTAVVAAAGSITSNASPRAAALLLEDKAAQSALSTFVAAFIFSIVGLIALGTGLYEAPARFVLFCATLAVLALVVIRLLGWMDRVSRMGRVGAAVDQVERALTDSLRRRKPFLGARPADDVVSGAPLLPEKVGYVQHIDVGRLDAVARRRGLQIHIRVLPGAFVRLSTPVLLVEGVEAIGEDVASALRAAVLVGGRRTYQQDPRFGLVMLAEIASRALSPALNDPGTAIDVIGTAARVLSVWGERHWEEEEAPQPEYRRVTAPGLSAADCFDDVFSPIARDGAGFVEVGVALQKTLADLGRSGAAGFSEAARRHAARALRLAARASLLPEDLQLLKDLAAAGETSPT
jgi:uncharacterized membrane protein